jgi:hypothetical protein
LVAAIEHVGDVIDLVGVLGGVAAKSRFEKRAKPAGVARRAHPRRQA